MKNVRIRVREACSGNFWDYAIWNGNKILLQYKNWYHHKYNAIRRAKAVAKLLRIKYDPKIKIDHGC